MYDPTGIPYLTVMQVILLKTTTPRMTTLMKRQLASLFVAFQIEKERDGQMIRKKLHERPTTEAPANTGTYHMRRLTG
eukprot:1181603-Prorocentrum_minimum.AAC.2